MGCNICVCNGNVIGIEEEVKLPSSDRPSKTDNIIKANFPENKNDKLPPDLNAKIDINIVNYYPTNNNEEDKNKTNNIIESFNNLKLNSNILNNGKAIDENNNENNYNNNENKNNNNNYNENNENKTSSYIKNDYNSRIVNLINEIRSDPAKYSSIILDNIQYISKEVRIVANDETGQNEEKVEILFQKKVKVKLYEGERAFIKASDYIKYIKPMDELIFKEEIKLELPNTEEEMNDKLFLKSKLKMLKDKYNICAFFKDSIKNPEVALLLMIVGDYANTENKKRNALLNPEYKYIAVNSKFLGNTFLAYFTFSK
jgi:hypothetical protein